MCNTTFVSGADSEWKTAVIVPLNKGKGRKLSAKAIKVECDSKICAGMLVGRVHRVSEELIGDEQEVSD